MELEIGVVEGFYGAPWTWRQRSETLDFFAEEGFTLYLYAPKRDPWLRKAWRQPHPDDEAAALRELSRQARDRGVSFGLGLSPFALHADLASGRADLERRAAELAALEPAWLAILFDDMDGSVPDLAVTQAEIVHLAAAASGVARVAMCPTYYTTAPILDRLFGQRPDRYLEDLGAALDPRVDVLWTGPQVCSSEYPADHLDAVATALGRPPLLWDNYPVNDGPRMCKKLHLRPFSGRDAVPGRARGVLANPMNQCRLSWSVLETLPAALGGTTAPPRSASRWLSGELAALLDRDAERFQEDGLDELDLEERATLAAAYRATRHPAGDEVAHWLDGLSIVGNECLTD